MDFWDAVVSVLALVGTAIFWFFKRRTKRRPRGTFEGILPQGGEVCGFCGQQMDQVDGCPVSQTMPIQYPDGKPRSPVPHKDEEGKSCPYCHVAPGKYHHRGCIVELCPRCNEPMVFGCQCGAIPEGLEGIYMAKANGS